MKKPKIIGERIRERRLYLGMTQDELAQITNYTSKSAISRIENGLNEVSPSKLAVFADALQTTPYYLSGYIDDPSTDISTTMKLGALAEELDDLQVAYQSAPQHIRDAIKSLLKI